MDRVLAVARPAFDAASVVDIARRTFGVEAAAARDLGSERDQTFLLLDADDAPLAVLKLSNAAEDPATLDMEALAVLHDWASRGACRTSDPDSLFVQGAAQNRAKAVCMGCPVRTECLSDALDNRVEFGVWGGMTERERRAILRKRPNVTSWRTLLETAMTEHAGITEAVEA